MGLVLVGVRVRISIEGGVRVRFWISLVPGIQFGPAFSCVCKHSLPFLRYLFLPFLSSLLHSDSHFPSSSIKGKAPSTSDIIYLLPKELQSKTLKVNIISANCLVILVWQVVEIPLFYCYFYSETSFDLCQTY